MLIFYDFIQVFVFTRNHHLNVLVVLEVTYLRRQVTLVFNSRYVKHYVTLCKLDVNVKNRMAVAGSLDLFKRE